MAIIHMVTKVTLVQLVCFPSFQKYVAQVTTNLSAKEKTFFYMISILLYFRHLKTSFSLAKKRTLGDSLSSHLLTKIKSRKKQKESLSLWFVQLFTLAPYLSSPSIPSILVLPLPVNSSNHTATSENSSCCDLLRLASWLQKNSDD